MPAKTVPTSRAAEVQPRASVWILNSWRDLILFVGTPLLILPLVGSAQQRWTVEDISLFVASFGAMGHHLPGMMRAYGDRELFARYRTRFIAAPLFLGLVCLLFGALDLQGIVLIVFFWGTWHALMQTYGFLRIYDAKRGSHGALTCRLDLAMCVAWFGAAILWSPTRMPDVLHIFYQSGGIALPSTWVTGSRNMWTAGTALVTILFLWNLWRMHRSGRPFSPIKLLLMATTFAFYAYANMAVPSMLLGVALFEIFHDVQYLALVWMFNRNRARREGGAGGFTRLLFGRGGSLIGVYVGLVFGYGALNLVPQGISGETLRNSVTGLLAASGLLHFYYDGFIWKVRESSTRRSLGVKEPVGGAPEPRSLAPARRHGLKWGLFALPALVLGLTQMLGAPAELDRRKSVVSTLPDNAYARYDLGVALAGDGEISAAMAEYREAIRLRPDYPEAHTRLGVALGSQGRLEEALSHFRHALRAHPRNFEARNNLAVTLHMQGEIEAAVPEYEEALRIQPRSVEARYNLGGALLSLGRRDEARGQFEHVLQIDPGHASARARLADLGAR